MCSVDVERLNRVRTPADVAGTSVSSGRHPEQMDEMNGVEGKMKENQTEECTERLHQMLALLGFSAEIQAETTEEGIVLHVKTEDSARMIGRKGRTLESLEFLMTRMSRKGENAGPNIILDIEGYRRRRGGRSRPRGGEGGKADTDSIIRQRALDAAKEVKRWGEPQRIGPCNSHDRKVIHRTLAEEDEELVTESGEPTKDGLKEVTIRLKTASDNVDAPPASDD